MKDIIFYITLAFAIWQLALTTYRFKRYKDRTGGKVRSRYRKAHKGFFGFYICTYCFKLVHYKKMEVDHIYPFDRNGSNHLWNLTCACHKCNDAKKAKTGLWVIRGYLGKIFFELFWVWLGLGLYLTYSYWSPAMTNLLSPLFNYVYFLLNWVS